MHSERLPDWDQIVAQHASRVFRVAMRILGNAQDAEDAAQEAFVEALRLHQSGVVQHWTALLVRLATLRSLDALRRRRTTQSLRDEDRISPTGPFDEVAACELAERLRLEIGRLPEQQATVFVLHSFENLTRDEICATLSISPEAVSTALYKARQRLLAQLDAIQQGQM